MSPKILKASGVYEEFNPKKLQHSLELSGVADHLIPQIIKRVEINLKEGTTTKELHELTRDLIRTEGFNKQSVDFDLRRAVMRLGPSGYPFEKYFSRLLVASGHQVEVDVVVKGRCISHEIDIVAHYNNRHFLIECKYHNQAGTKTDSQVALYTYARYEDIKDELIKTLEHKDESYEVWLVTNTKASKDAIDYANCQHMTLISWTYPPKNNLKDMILTSGLHPVTSVTSLSDRQITALLNQNIITVKDLEFALSEDKLTEIISPDDKDSVMKEVQTFSH